MNRTTNLLLGAIFIAIVILIADDTLSRYSPPASHWRYDSLEVTNDATALGDAHDCGSFARELVLNTKFDAMVSAGWELFAAVPEVGTKDGYVRTEKMLLIFRRPS